MFDYYHLLVVVGSMDVLFCPYDSTLVMSAYLPHSGSDQLIL